MEQSLFVIEAGKRGDHTVQLEHSEHPSFHIPFGFYQEDSRGYDFAYSIILDLTVQLWDVPLHVRHLCLLE